MVDFLDGIDGIDRAGLEKFRRPACHHGGARWQDLGLIKGNRSRASSETVSRVSNLVHSDANSLEFKVYLAHWPKSHRAPMGHGTQGRRGVRKLKLELQRTPA